MGRRFRFRTANSTLNPNEATHVTSPTASNIAAAFAGVLARRIADPGKRGVEKTSG
jgi:hypothetical protein